MLYDLTTYKLIWGQMRHKKLSYFVFTQLLFSVRIIQLQVAWCADLQFGLPPGDSLELLIEKNANYKNPSLVFFI